MHVLPRLAFKRLLVTAALGGLLPFAAQADDPVNGKALYTTHCASCHGANPLTSNSNKIYNSRNARAAIDAGISNVGDMNSLRPSFPSGGTALADMAAYLGNTPASLAFASTAVGSTSATQSVTVYASLKSGNALSGLTVATSGDFARTGGSCGTTLATGTSCTVLVAFTPTASGARSGSLSLTHNNTLTPIALALSGTGAASAAPVANLSPTTMALAATAIGATSATQTATLSNSGSAALAISAINLSNSADFVIAGGTCNAGVSVAAGASCTIALAFKPAVGTTGTRSGALQVSHNAAGSPSSVSLSGNATAAAAPAAALTPSLAFGSINVGTTGAAQTATLSNTGNAPLTIGTLSTGSSEFTLGGGSCAAGAVVAAGSSCTVAVSFTPAAAGARSASLVITHNASGGQSSTSLAGTGVALSPVIGVSPTTLSFSQTSGTVSVAQTVTVSNTGNAPLAISALSIGGAQAAEFLIASDSTCAVGGSVAANASCQVKLVFAPAATGARSASLAIVHSAAGSPSNVTLNGSGTTVAQPAISLNAATLSFAAQVLGSTSPSQSVTVSNGGAAPLNFSSLTLTGTAASDFTRGGTCTATGTLAVGASCTVTLSFTPGAVGTRSATLTLASDASNGSAVLSLSGSGVAAAAPAVSLAPGAVDFGNQTIGVTSNARSVTLTNSGSGALSLSSISATAGFGVGHNCGASLAAGSSCTLSTTFTPAAGGATTGNISVASNAAGSPHGVTLAGTGVAASPVLVWSPATATLDFGDAGVGGAPASHSLTLLNQGPGAVTLQQFTLAGAQAADFALASASTCAVNATLSQGASCGLVLTFQPGAVGARNALLQMAASGTLPPDVALTGNATALAQPDAVVVPAALSFNAPGGVQTLTLQSTGSAGLQVTALRVATGSFTIAPAPANGCPATPFDLLPGQSCALSVAWSNTAPGAEAGSVEIDTSAAATPLVVPLQAMREAPAGLDGGTPTGLSNAGAGGCSIAQGDSLADPTLWLLALAAASVLAWRRRSAA